MLYLSDSLEEVTVGDINWAVRNNYEVDVIWVALNIVSIFSSKRDISCTRKEFKELTGHYPYCGKSSPMCDWCGWYNDLVEITSIITTKSKFEVDKRLRILTKDESSLVSIRLRNFAYSSKKPLYGQSIHLKKDYNLNFYMWIYNSSGVLTPVPEQMLKEQLILWDNRH